MFYLTRKTVIMVILPYNLQNGALDSRVHAIKGMFLERKNGEKLRSSEAARSLI